MLAWRVLAAAVLVAVAEFVAAPSSIADEPQRTLGNLVADYRGSSPRRAVEELARWEDAQAERATDEFAATAAPSDLAALSLLQTEVGLARGDFGAYRPGLAVLSNSVSDREIHFRLAFGLVDRLTTRPDDATMAAFARGWCAVAVRFAPRPVLDLIERRFPDDPQMLLVRGAHAEFWAGPEFSD